MFEPPKVFMHKESANLYLYMNSLGFKHAEEIWYDEPDFDQPFPFHQVGHLTYCQLIEHFEDLGEL